MRQSALPEIAHLDELELFQGLLTDELHSLHDVMQYRLFHKNDLLLEQGQSGKAILFLHHGVVKIYDGASETLKSGNGAKVLTVINLVGPGELLGEINAMDRTGHSASAIALESASCFMLDNHHFHNFRREMPRFGINIDRYLSASMRRQTIRYCCALQQDLTGRLAALLLHLAGRFGNDECQIDLPLTHALLGQMTGHTRESICKKVDRFETNGWISTRPNHRIALLNCAALKNCCRRV